MSNPISDNPPPVPPKQAASSRRPQQPTHHSTRSNTRTDPPHTHAHTHHSSRSADATTRTRPSRSQTTGFPATTNTTSRPQATQPRRSHSSDSAPSDKSKPHRSKTKKGSIHADVIDRLDFTGVGPMFHHDGPFDACAPSRNRHRTKAPMYAWTSINAEDEEVAARYREKEGGMPIAPALSYNTSYPTELPRSPPAAANYTSYYSEPPKKKVDAIAEAWGIHEPEPYEEFSAGGGDIDGPISNGSSMKEARSNGGRTRGEPVSRTRGSGSNRIPPPQPIFVPDVSGVEVPSPQHSPSSGGANVSRNKSFMQRIRRMRDSPNVPVGFDDTASAPSDGAPSPTSSAESGSHGRPAHRRVDLLLGRFTRGGRGDTSPTAPDPYVYVDELPAAPTSPADGYYDGPRSPGSGMSRKTSILKRVRGVVRGSK